MDQLAGKKVIVTGAGGFIGSHLVEALVGAGAKVRAMVHYNALGGHGWLDSSPMLDQIEVVPGDILDRDSVSGAVQSCEIVFHLAALIAIPYSYRAPESYVRTNVLGTLNVLQSARENHVRRMVQTSTSEVYGTALRVPISEDHPLQGQSPYAATKIAADKLTEAFHRSYDLPVVTVRPFNTFGPRQSARAVIPSIIGQCLAGQTIRLGNLHPTRDFNFVGNTVDGFIAAACCPDAVGRTINLGSGREVTIAELASLIGKLCDRQISVETDALRLRPAASEVDRLLADNTHARQVLGWAPRTSLEEGLLATIEWMRQNSRTCPLPPYVL